MIENEFDSGYAAKQLARREHRWRRRVKQFYLDRILRQVDGPTLDIGCGAGQLLEQLPPGSRGLEVNPVLVAQLRERRLAVDPVLPSGDAISVGATIPGQFRCVVLSHVLEHFDDAATVLQRLIDDCRRLRVERLIVVVPGAVGYRSDATHKTFVDVDYLRKAGLLQSGASGSVEWSYFPGNTRSIGRLFIYHELMIVYRFP